MSNWIEISVQVSGEAQEAATQILYTEGAEGVWLDDTGENLVIRTYLSEEDVNPEKLAVIRQKVLGLSQFDLDPGEVKVFSHVVNEEDWATSWKEYFYPEKITDQFVVKPTWRDYKARPGEMVIEIDPGMAFGTGTHASTYLALQGIEEISSRVQTMLDVGTGSGILAIAGAMLGIEKITAVDLESVAVKVAKENIMVNNVQKKVQVMRSDLVERIKEKGKTYQLITANILADIILRLIPDLPDVLEAGGYFIASGIITSRFEDIRQALLDTGLKLERIYRDGEWVAVTARR